MSNKVRLYKQPGTNTGKLFIDIKMTNASIYAESFNSHPINYSFLTLYNVWPGWLRLFEIDQPHT